MDLLTIAKNIADRVEAESRKQDVLVAVTVIDIHGNIVLTHRMTGAPLSLSSSLSERLTRPPSSACAPLTSSPSYNQARSSIHSSPSPAVDTPRWAAPVTSDGQVIAGVGVSGGTTEQDIAIVEAAMR
jgi:uncharacterized protein GlcG (DUF336 family)